MSKKEGDGQLAEKTVTEKTVGGKTGAEKAGKAATDGKATERDRDTMSSADKDVASPAAGEAKDETASADETVTTLAAQDGKTPAKKGRKESKTFPKKKLPRLLRKRYSQRKLDRKILKKVYIPRDKDFIASVFLPVEGAKKPCLAIPDDRLFTKQELVRLKNLSKEIRRQHGRVKLIPLAATAGAIVLMVSALLIFKDPLVKKGLQSVMQSIFGAKVDIAYLHLGILDTNFTIRGLEVANRNDTMKNLFEIGGLTVDFDLLQLLKKRFVSDEMSVTDVRVNTERETDGALPPDYAQTSRLEQVKSKVTAFTLEKTEVLKGSVTEIFAQYDPETLINNFYSRLSTPDLVREIEQEVNAVIDAWKPVPDELAASVNRLVADGQAVANFDWNSVQSDPTQIRGALASIKAATDSATALYRETEQSMNMLQRDARLVQEMADRSQRAVTADFDLIGNEVNKIASFSIKEDGMEILSTGLEKIIADLFGQYYPMFQEIMVYVQDISAKSAAKEAEETAAKEEEKPSVQRYEGRTIEYRVDNIPSFLIKKMHGSGADGSFSLSLDANDISNDMTKWGRPASVSGVVGHGAMSDSFYGALDLRENRPGDLVELNYSGAGYTVDMTVPEEEAIPGVPTGIGTGAFTARVTANETGDFSVGGSITLDPVSFTTAAFEPAFAYDLYSRALAMFTSVQAGLTLGYSNAGGLSLDIDSDIDRRFMEVLARLFNEELAKVKEQITARAQVMLDEGTARIKEKFGDFDDIKARMDEQSARLNAYREELERKRREGEEKLNAAVNAAKDAATQAAEETIENAKSSAVDALKGLFGR